MVLSLAAKYTESDTYNIVEEKYMASYFERSVFK